MDTTQLPACLFMGLRTDLRSDGAVSRSYPVTVSADYAPGLMESVCWNRSCSQEEGGIKMPRAYAPELRRRVIDLLEGGHSDAELQRWSSRQST